MKTSCKKCVFSIKDEVGNQTGCEFNRLEKFTLDPRVSLSIVDNPSHYEINGRVCTICRAEETGWGKEFPMEEKKKIVREEIRCNIALICICDHFSKQEDIIKTAESWSNQSFPAEIHFVFTSNKPSTGTIIQELRKKFPTSSNLTWRTHLCYERQSDGKPLERDQAIDIAANLLNPKDFQFYLVVDPGCILPNKLSESLDYLVNEELIQFVYLNSYKDDNKTIGPLVYLLAHHQLGGNKRAFHDVDDKSIECNSIGDKIKLLAKDNNQEFLIMGPELLWNL